MSDIPYIRSIPETQKEAKPLGFLRFLQRLVESLIRGLSALLVMLMAIPVIYKPVEFSEKHFPEKLQLIILFIYAVGLSFCIYLMLTEEIRRKQTTRIKEWFGPYGLLFLPLITLTVAATVLASLTLSLYNHQWVALEPCSGRPVAPGSLMDFYMWHFLKLVPLLKLNETLKWGEPLCYRQARVGLLILLFQALIVIPSIDTVRFYWRNLGIPR